MNKVVNQTHQILNTYFSQCLGKDSDAPEYRVLHPHMNIKINELTEAVRKYFNDRTLIITTIYNPDTNEQQTPEEFIKYINEYGLGMWDTGSED